MVNGCRVLKTRASLPLARSGVEKIKTKKAGGVSPKLAGLWPKLGETTFLSEAMSCLREGRSHLGAEEEEKCRRCRWL